jgi:hypothetical protein
VHGFLQAFWNILKQLAAWKNRIEGFAESSHSHSKNQIVDFAHTHAYSEISGTPPAPDLSGKADDQQSIDNAVTPDPDDPILISTAQPLTDSVHGFLQAFWNILKQLAAWRSQAQTDIANKANAVHSHTASQVSGLAQVAASGDYNDLLNTPSSLNQFPDVPDDGHIYARVHGTWISIGTLPD